MRLYLSLVVRENYQDIAAAGVLNDEITIERQVKRIGSFCDASFHRQYYSVLG